MLAEVWAGFAEAAEVDDAPEAGLLGGEGELEGEVMVLSGVGGPGGGHGVDEVEGGGAALQVLGEGVGLGEVSGADFEVRVAGPVAGEEFAGGAGEAADVVSGFEEGVGEATANVAGGSENGDGRGCGGDGSQVKMERETGLEPVN